METLRILSLAVFVNLCYPQEVPCNVSHSPQGIIYRVPEFQAQACDYHWDNASGHVLANQKGKMDKLVLKSSNRSIMITSCLSHLNYTRDCISEGIQRRASCDTDCSTPGGGIPQHYWYMITSFSITALLVLLVCICRYFKSSQVKSSRLYCHFNHQLQC
ncbi:uncharacterized protein LOC143421769 [Maylandia zebra]|uniref:uncharacterized protein LOC143421769 n=1 Tax=Maylandia zebra TaxID=106582 RepID=UPI00403C3F09